MLPLEGTRVPPAHLRVQLEQLREPLEALGGARHRQAHRLRLHRVPHPDAQPGPATGEDVQRRYGLEDDRGLPVGDWADQAPEAHAACHRGEEAEDGVDLEHVALIRRRAGIRLQKVVVDPDRVQARLVRGGRYGGEVAGQVRGVGRPREVRQ